MTYDRDKALLYAEGWALKVCHDGFVGLRDSHKPPYAKVAAGATFDQNQSPIIPGKAWSDVDDGAHFISCCIGSHKQGGGGFQGQGNEWRESSGAPYGIMSTQKFVAYFMTSGVARGAVKVLENRSHIPSISSSSTNFKMPPGLALEPGDLIAYYDNVKNVYKHVVLYIGNGNIAAHTPQTRESQWNNFGEQPSPNWRWTVLHFITPARAVKFPRPVTPTPDIQRHDAPKQHFTSATVVELSFRDDHHQRKEPRPAFRRATSDKAAVSHPISYLRNKLVHVEVTIEVTPSNALPLTAQIRGDLTYGNLKLTFQDILMDERALHGGKNVIFLTASEKLPDQFTKLEGKIDWKIEYDQPGKRVKGDSGKRVLPDGDSGKAAMISGHHIIYVT